MTIILLDVCLDPWAVFLVFGEEELEGARINQELNDSPISQELEVNNTDF